ncbi:MAG: chromate transporter [Clostridium sp.]|uniref:chromate transporter n=1 Tax=Clostridium sp. TaxID=1506 RepID=UPI003F2AC92C
MLLAKIYFAFLKIGALAFGGGYAMLPYIQKIVVTDHHWLTSSQFTSYIGIVQISPGAVSCNLSAFIGFKLYGLLGGIVAILGLATAPMILVTIAYFAFSRMKNSKIWNAALVGMKPALIALIISAFISLSRSAYRDWKEIVITIIAGILLFSKKVNLIFIVLICALLGLILH